MDTCHCLLLLQVVSTCENRSTAYPCTRLSVLMLLPAKGAGGSAGQEARLLACGLRLSHLTFHI